jgi:catechol 2,3-dioxygenase-like lactoylglutathione lyase family enzyme
MKGKHMAYTIRSVAHTGITVSNLEQALRFWTDILGFEFIASDDVGGAFLAGTTGVSGGHLRAALVTKGGQLSSYCNTPRLTTERPCERGRAMLARYTSRSRLTTSRQSPSTVTVLESEKEQTMPDLFASPTSEASASYNIKLKERKE